MKPGALSTPSRDLGRPAIRAFGESLIRRLEALEARLTPEGQAPPVLSAERSLLDKLDQQTGDGVTLERKRIRDRALDEEYFQREMAAGLATYEAGAADAVNANSDVMRLPVTLAGTNPMVKRMLGMNALWPRTRPRLTLWYTSPAGSTNLFNLRFQLRMYAVGGTTAPAVLFSTIFQPAGPAVANTILTASVVGGAVVPSVTAPLRLAVVRIGGDANVNDLDILLALVTFEEIA